MPLWSSSNSNPQSADPYAPPNDTDNDFSSLLTTYKPLLQKLTLSSVMGYCSAITAKRIGKSMAFVVGLGFVVLQGLVHKGYIEVDWKKVQKSTTDVIDTDKDGEITEKDIQRYWDKVKKILTNNIPDASGFGLGFMFGLRG